MFMESYAATALRETQKNRLKDKTERLEIGDLVEYQEIQGVRRYGVVTLVNYTELRISCYGNPLRRQQVQEIPIDCVTRAWEGAIPAKKAMARPQALNRVFATASP